MSNHPTSELSPRDIACVRYGKWLNRVLAASRRIRAIRKGEFFAFDLEREKKSFAQLISKARAARNRIFRNCSQCVYCLDFQGILNGKKYYGCQWTPRTPEDAACTCKKYFERSSHEQKYKI